MKLKSFRINNYKSIIDSGECIISDIDNITILAGQNESGKSSILQALRDFHKDSLTEDAIRIENEVVKIKCTYSIGKDDHQMIMEAIQNVVQLPESIEKHIKTLKQITLIRTFDEIDVPTLEFSDEEKNIFNKLIEEEVRLLEQMKSLIGEIETSKEISADETLNDEIDDVEEDETVKIIDVKSQDYLWNLISTIDDLKPTVIFFDEFCDLLPDKILISDLIKRNNKASGYQAVKNIETILEDDLAKLDKLGDPQRNRAQTIHNKSITANFNEKWTQRINAQNEAKIYIEYNQGRDTDSSYLNFFIETKDQEFLPPRQRSQGFRWFLSFYLHLKAESERNKSLIILFDEPGLFLHSRAQKDMVNVFEELAKKNQIIYSTHSPYLIDASKLHRIKLVINSKEAGTTIEKITTSKIKNQKDALKPIIDAVGLEVANNFSAAKQKNVILEGISDFYYLEAFRKLLVVKQDFAFIPAMGHANVHLLMELCIGWGLEWLIVFDEKGITKEYNKIKKLFFNNNEDEVNNKIMKLSGFEGIEELFDDSDFSKLLPEIIFTPGENKGAIISDNIGKELTARLFLEKVSVNEYTKAHFSKKTIKNFESIFSFIIEGFKLKK